MATRTGVTQVCSVPDCSSHVKSKLSFFRFPQDDERCKVWAKAFNIPGISDKPLAALKTFKACELHFDNWCFTSEGTNASRKRLIKYAVPTKQRRPPGDSVISYKDGHVGGSFRIGSDVIVVNELIEVEDGSKSLIKLEETTVLQPSHQTPTTANDIAIPTKDASTSCTLGSASMLQLEFKLKETMKKLQHYRGIASRHNKRIEKIKLAMKNVSAKKLAIALKKYLNSSIYDFVLSQFRPGLKSHRGMRWHSKIKDLVVTIYRDSFRAYKMMETIFHVPTKGILLNHEKEMKDIVHLQHEYDFLSSVLDKSALIQPKIYECDKNVAPVRNESLQARKRKLEESDYPDDDSSPKISSVHTISKANFCLTLDETGTDPYINSTTKEETTLEGQDDNAPFVSDNVDRLLQTLQTAERYVSDVINFAKEDSCSLSEFPTLTDSRTTIT